MQYGWRILVSMTSRMIQVRPFIHMRISEIGVTVIRSYKISVHPQYVKAPRVLALLSPCDIL